jgi:uncharacterized delta-60 repeat protein
LLSVHSPIESLEPRRLWTTLAPDPAWGDGGYVSNDAFDTFVSAKGDGVLTTRIIYNPKIGKNVYFVMRFTDEGVPDPAFTPITTTDRIEVRADDYGRPVVGRGDLASAVVKVSRYTLAGAPDGHFGTHGTVKLPVDPVDLYTTPQLAALAPSADGGTYVAVSYRRHVGTRYSDWAEVFKLNSVGQRDTDFGNGGSILLRASAFGGNAAFLAEDARRRLLAGVQDGVTVIRRYDNNGTQDFTFGDSRGRVTIGQLSFGNSGPTAGGIVVDRAGCIVSTDVTGFGNNTADVAVRRFTANGRPDPTFGNQSGFNVQSVPVIFGDTPRVSPLLVQHNGRIVAQFGTKVIRLRADGKTDRTFDADGFKILADGRLAGQFRDGGLLAINYSTEDHPVDSVSLLTES